MLRSLFDMEIGPVILVPKNALERDRMISSVFLNSRNSPVGFKDLCMNCRQSAS